MTTPAAWLAHYPLSAALKAHAEGRPLPVWELHPVDVEAARPAADALHFARRFNPRVAFPGRVDGVEVIPPTGVVEELKAATVACVDAVATLDKIAVPDERTANVSPVEQPAGEGERLPSGPSPATLAEGQMVDWLAACAADPSIVTPREMGYNPDGTRRAYELDKFDRPVLPPADEGDDADPAAIAALKARYAALKEQAGGKEVNHHKLTPFGWVNAIAKQAQAAGGALSLADSQPQTVRRFEAMRALVLLAEGGFADDDATRGILRPILGDVADMAAFSVGKLVGSLTPAEAAVFAQLADTVATGSIALSVKLDGRYEWEFAA